MSKVHIIHVMRKALLLSLTLLLSVVGTWAQEEGRWLSDSATVYIVIATAPTQGNDIESCFGHVTFWFVDPYRNESTCLSFNSQRDDQESTPLHFLWGGVHRCVAEDNGNDYFEEAKEKHRCLTVCRLNLTPLQADSLYRSLWDERNSERPVPYNIIYCNCSSSAWELLDNLFPITWPNREKVENIHTMIQRQAADFPLLKGVLTLIETRDGYRMRNLQECIFDPICLLELVKGATIEQSGSRKPLVTGLSTFDYRITPPAAPQDKDSQGLERYITIIVMLFWLLFIVSLWVKPLQKPAGYLTFVLVGIAGIILWYTAFSPVSPQREPLTNAGMWLLQPLPLLYVLLQIPRRLRYCHKWQTGFLCVQTASTLAYPLLALMWGQEIMLPLAGVTLVMLSWSIFYLIQEIKLIYH